MATPMQQQYDSLKKKYDDCILLFRLGDFYECFDNDAKIISKVLGIMLTSRGKGEHKRPMAGIPHHALHNYLPKLVKAGYKAAIVEQMEKPQKGKTLVKRDVVKIISAGTFTDEKNIDESRNNYISSLYRKSDKKSDLWFLAVCDLTTGEFYVEEIRNTRDNPIVAITDHIKRITPSEILVQNSLVNDLKKFLAGIRIQPIDEIEYNLSENISRLKEHLKVKSLKGFGIDQSPGGIIASGVLIRYLQETQKTDLIHITSIRLKKSGHYMHLDENTIRSLELVVPLRADASATVLKVIDRCNTAMGKRLLYQWLISPLVDAEDVTLRHDTVSYLFNNNILLDQLREKLDNICDVERVIGRIGTENVNARDLLAMKSSLEQVTEISFLLNDKEKPSLLMKLKHELCQDEAIKQVVDLITKSIADDPLATITEGGIIKEGYDQELDEIRGAATGGKEWIKKLQEQEIRRSGISSLKVKFNKVFGFYIEVSNSNLSKVPSDYIRKQTLVNAERFITPELKEKEDMILHAEEKSLELEYQIFLKVRSLVAKYVIQLQRVANAIAIIDCLVNFAFIARNNNYVRPEIVTSENGLLTIKNGRHPVVEQLTEEPFISNDTELNNNEKQVAIITGPNMAGKSTYIRQVALLILLAQIGSFVPAEKMSFTPVDRIFTRVGASDNLAAGESTFLVEMSETANILHNATARSLIILDEIGRGTSTYDGVAIAWAVVEYIHENIGAKTLFATHYHELVDMSNYLSRVFNLNVAIEESKGEILFLRKIQDGGTDRSYGVHVAQLAGIPEGVIKKAQEILLSLEQEGMFEVKHVESELTQRKHKPARQLTLLTELPEHPVLDELRKLEVNKMTPLAALEKLDEIVKKL